MDKKFDQSAYLEKLDTQWLGQSLQYFDELPSTNTYLKTVPKETLKQGMVCITDHQTKGRGQYERRWESEKNQNITFSMAFIPPTHERFHVLALACGLALVEQLNEFLQASCSALKWPNDVMLNEKKTAGILAETVFSGNNFDRLIIGIGINANQKKFSDELKTIATSVALESEKEIAREEFLAELLNRIEYKYRLWQQQKPDLIKIINRNIIGYGQWVGLKIDNQLQEDRYKLLGIDEIGQLLMLNRDGGIESFSYEQIQLVTN